MGATGTKAHGGAPREALAPLAPLAPLRRSSKRSGERRRSGDGVRVEAEAGAEAAARMRAVVSAAAAMATSSKVTLQLLIGGSHGRRRGASNGLEPSICTALEPHTHVRS